MSANILIAVAAYGGSIRNECAMTLLKLAAAGQRHQIKLTFSIIDRLGIDMLRNAYASLVYQERAFTHLFFVDSDMEFEPSALLRPLAADKPVIGCACPKRSINLSRVRDGKSGLQFTAHFRDQPKQITHHNGLCRVDGIGMGVTLIRRDALERLVASGTLTKKSTGAFSDIPAKTIYGFFDSFKSDGEDLGEDISFCRRWQDCQGEIWSLIDEEIGHIGTFNYRGRMIDSLRRR